MLGIREDGVEVKQLSGHEDEREGSRDVAKDQGADAYSSLSPHNLVTGSDSVSSPEVRAREVERLWAWGMHEDGLLVNRMSVCLLAESILLVSAVGILVAPSPGFGERLVQFVFDVVGIVITVALWHVFTLHADHIRLVSEELKNKDAAVYRYIHDLMAARRAGRFMQRRVFRGAGTKWIMSSFISGAILLIWLALLSAAIAAAVGA